jgi:hypothetical protein
MKLFFDNFKIAGGIERAKMNCGKMLIEYAKRKSILTIKKWKKDS